MSGPTLTDTDLAHLRRCQDLAEAALEVGDDPFGSLLVDAAGTVRLEERNRVSGGDATRHPEFEIARWAAANLSPSERASATVYTSGEHCPMCAAAHGWVGLDRIVYAVSSTQLQGWLREWGVPAGPVASLPISTVLPGAATVGPVPELLVRGRELYRRRYRTTGAADSHP